MKISEILKDTNFDIEEGEDLAIEFIKKNIHV
jgi:hypothetical protein